MMQRPLFRSLLQSSRAYHVALGNMETGSLPIYFYAKDEPITALASLPAQVHEDFTGKRKSSMVVYTGEGRAVLVGMGKVEDIDETCIRECVVAGLQAAKGLKTITTAVLHVPTTPLCVERVAELMAQSSMLSDYKFDKYLSKKKKDAKGLETVLVQAPVTCEQVRGAPCFE